MDRLKAKIDEFLAQKVIAVAGVTRNHPNEAANAIYRKLKGAGYHVYAVNPNAKSVEGDPCYHDLAAIPEPVDGVVVVTRPETADKIARECVQAKVPRAWLHRSFGPGSVSSEAVTICEQNNITVIAGACPMMYCEPVDTGHKCIRWFLKVTKKLPN